MNKRYLCSIEISALYVSLSGQNADVLPERILFDHGSKAVSNFPLCCIEWNPLSRDTLIDGNNVEPVPSPDQLP